MLVNVDNALIDHLSELAKLEFSADAKEGIKQDLNRMLEFVDKLNELDTEGVEPLIYMTDEINILREDTPEETISQDEALKNAPKRDSDYFKVPKVLSKE